MAAVDQPEAKKRPRTRRAGPKSVAQILAVWKKKKQQQECCPPKRRKAQAVGSRKGCMRGKGGPENSSWSFRGARQRKSGRWVSEIRAPNHGERLWLGTFTTAAEAARAYDEAAKVMYGDYARLNFPDMEKMQVDAFATAVEAAQCAYDGDRKIIDGDYARLNLPDWDSASNVDSSTNGANAGSDERVVDGDDSEAVDLPEEMMLDVEEVMRMLAADPIDFGDASLLQSENLESNSSKVLVM